jgi:hypothetical protein
MKRGEYPLAAFGYISDRFRLLVHHNPETVKDGKEHDTVDPTMLVIAMRTIDIVPIFEPNEDEIREEIRAHLNAHFEAIAEMDEGEDLRGRLREAAKVFNTSDLNSPLRDKIQLLINNETMIENEKLDMEQNLAPDHTPGSSKAGGSREKAVKVGVDDKDIKEEKTTEPQDKKTDKKALPNPGETKKGKKRVQLPVTRGTELTKELLEEHFANSNFAEGELLGSKSELLEVKEVQQVKTFTLLVGPGEEGPNWMLLVEVMYDGEGNVLNVRMPDFEFGIPEENLPDIIKFLENLPKK